MGYRETFVGQDDRRPDRKYTDVVGWSAPGLYGATVYLSETQEAAFRAAGVWPRCPDTGKEYCQVSKGRAQGVPTWADAEVEALVAHLAS